MHLNSQLIFKKYALTSFREGIRVLEIGPDKPAPSTYRELTGVRNMTWETLDIYEHPDIDHFADSHYEFPLDDGAYDVVVSGQVIEHVKKIWVWIEELARVCKPGGHVITINPISWPYHEAPVDCWRIYPEGMRAIYESAGLEIVLSKEESLEPFFPSARSFARFVAKPFLSGRGVRQWPVVDAITIGKKPEEPLSI